jgi:C4-dicarboxylate-specific signal transduction histidine kinase
MCHIGVELGNDDAAVHVDAVQLTQVILNLVNNALDASENCPPERREVLITTRSHGDKTVGLCVRDAGSGIAPETLNRLFSPFFSSKPGGLGVGLRLSQTIVQAHGGSIEGFNNTDGVGATFRVVLPAHWPV